MLRQVTHCPVCDAALRVTELSCTRCETRLHGSFPPPLLAGLGEEHQNFIETFVRCRGIIRDVERALGISYPTVRSRLDAAVVALEAAASNAPLASTAGDLPPFGGEFSVSDGARDARRRALLRQVEEGLLDPDTAADALRSF